MHSPRQPYWTVERHGGRSDHDWRKVYRGEADFAIAEFDRLRGLLRQGGLRLLDEHGGIVRSVWAPRLRTRW